MFVQLCEEHNAQHFHTRSRGCASVPVINVLPRPPPAAVLASVATPVSRLLAVVHVYACICTRVADCTPLLADPKSVASLARGI